MLAFPFSYRKRRYEQLQMAVYRTDAELQRKLDLLLTRAVVSCNLPFSAVGNPELVKLLVTLRPGYKPPCRKTVCFPSPHFLHTLYSSFRFLGHFWMSCIKVSTRSVFSTFRTLWRQYPLMVGQPQVTTLYLRWLYLQARSPT